MSSEWFLVVAAMGIVTYGIRALPFFLLARREMPQLAGRALRFVPAAVLSAIALPELLQPAGAPPGVFIYLAPENARLWAGVVAIGVAFYTKNVLLTIGVGMIVLWLLQLL